MYLAEDTIAALITPPGGPVVVLRISGPLAFVARTLLDEPRKMDEARPREVFLADLKTPDEKKLDRALIVKFEKPASFTGEDVVEFHLHGSPYIVSEVFRAIQGLGIRMALPGEFSFRAVRNGKMDLLQAQAVADLIAASNQAAVGMALEKMDGSQKTLFADIAALLKETLQEAELELDFSDQDVGLHSLADLKSRCALVEQTLSELRLSYMRGRRIQEGITAVIFGFPNAGKSSFFNALLGEDRAIVSAQPGTTRDVIREKLTLNGKNSSVTLKIADTAGIRKGRSEIEKQGIKRSLKIAEEADLILWVVDATEDSAAQAAEVKQLGLKNPNIIGIRNKADLLPSLLPAGVRPQGRPGEPQLQGWVEVCSLAGKTRGIHEAAQVIADFCETLTHRAPGETIITQIDQLGMIEKAQEALRRGERAESMDLLAADIRQALKALSPLIGETSPDEILSRIFEKFCIGK